jgi:ribonuclease HII
MILSTIDIERAYWNQGYAFVVGVDEVGRGSLAGPVMAAAVIVKPETLRINGVGDSKQLTRTKRSHIYRALMDAKIEYGLGLASAEEIDQLGIVAATDKAMELAVAKLTRVEVVLIDGNHIPKRLNQRYARIRSIVKGDQQCYSISAASIIAKVTRDSIMAKLDTKYPGYGWDRNVGYGTAAHRLAVSTLGLCQEHRISFRSRIFD